MELLKYTEQNFKQSPG